VFKVRIAIDIGGTYVDAVKFNEETKLLTFYKSQTTPADPVQGVIDALLGLGKDLVDTDIFVHGTTLGLNAILQRKGANVGLITNIGFEDILEIGRAAVPDQYMYDFFYAPPQPLVPRKHRIGVRGRIDALGGELIPINKLDILKAGRYLVEECDLKSLAVCFLHSYRNPIHEIETMRVLKEAFPQISISASVNLTREYGEYERTITTVLDAYISPILGDYLARLEQSLQKIGFKGRVQIMRSSGGAMEISLAKNAPLLTVLSGPAGGIAGAKYLSVTNGWPKIITFDVGGTSLDCCVILNHEPSEVHEAYIDDLPIQIPVFDIRTIGAGGGSIAKTRDQILQVGPESAGAMPGPACYGAGGDDPTITDAAIVLGYLDPERFLGGKLKVYPELSHKSIHKKISKPLKLTDTQASVRIFEILVAKTVGAIKQITIERGLDPREFKLIAFGGAGPLIGPMVGRELNLQTVVIPTLPGTFSALGMLMTDLEYEFSNTVLQPLDYNYEASINGVVREMILRANQILDQQNVDIASRVITTRLDLRYRGQEHTLSIDFTSGDSVDFLERKFQVAHQNRYGHSMNDRCEIASVRVKCFAQAQKPELPKIAKSNARANRASSREVYDFATSSMRSFIIYERDSLEFGMKFRGPAIVQESASATIIFSDQIAEIDEYGQILLSKASSDNE
jgi:N-methylhydantoinase A